MGIKGIKKQKNLLIDFVTLSRKTGAGEYLRCVLESLMDALSVQSNTIRLFALYDSTKGIAYNEIADKSYALQYNITMVDIAHRDLFAITKEFAIDQFFIGCAQYVCSYPGLSELQCEVIAVIHDLSYEELLRENLDVYNRYRVKSLYSFINWLMFHRQKDIKRNVGMLPFVKLCNNNPRTKIIAVSDYTRHSIRYNLHIPEDKISVLYSPERLYVASKEKTDAPLHSMIADGKKFFLLLGAQHSAKNAERAIRAFSEFSIDHSEYFLLTIGYKGSPQYPNHIVSPFLCDYDLQLAYQHCYALIYPSIVEGFGYPPLEAMRYKKPVLASDIGVIREIYGYAPIYFNPFFETDIYQTLCSLDENEYSAASKRSEAAYGIITKRQKADLKKLIDILT